MNFMLVLLASPARLCLQTFCHGGCINIGPGTAIKYSRAPYMSHAMPIANGTVTYVPWSWLEYQDWRVVECGLTFLSRTHVKSMRNNFLTPGLKRLSCSSRAEGQTIDTRESCYLFFLIENLSWSRFHLTAILWEGPLTQPGQIIGLRLLLLWTIVRIKIHLFKKHICSWGLQPIYQWRCGQYATNLSGLSTFFSYHSPSGSNYSKTLLKADRFIQTSRQWHKVGISLFISHIWNLDPELLLRETIPTIITISVVLFYCAILLLFWPFCHSL